VRKISGIASKVGSPEVGKCPALGVPRDENV